MKTTSLGRVRKVLILASVGLSAIFGGAVEASAATPPAKPANMTATAPGPTSVNLSWRDNSLNEAGFTGGQPSPPPSNMSVAGIPGGLRLTWYDNSTNETAWLIHDGSNAPQQSFTVDGSTVGRRSYDWSGMRPGEYKCLHVRGYNEYGAGDWPTNPYWACGTAARGTKPVAPSQVSHSYCYDKMQLAWIVGGLWDSFRVYKGRMLIKQLSAGDPDLVDYHTGQYQYEVPGPLNNVTVGVSAVKAGIESDISYTDNGNPPC
jgi:hypothetical protein